MISNFYYEKPSHFLPNRFLQFFDILSTTIRTVLKFCFKFRLVKNQTGIYNLLILK